MSSNDNFAPLSFCIFCRQEMLRCRGQCRQSKGSGSSRIPAATKSSTALAATKRPAAAAGVPFHVATYNVWFGPSGDGQPYPSRRMQGLVESLQPWIDRNELPLIGFQEVILPLYQPLKSLLEARGYQLFHQSPPSAYNVAMAVSNSCSILDQGFVPFPSSRMDRGLLYVRVRLENNTTCLFGTTHLESYISDDDNGALQRQVQVQQIDAFYQEHRDVYHPDVMCFLGDLNWDDTSHTKRVPSDQLLVGGELLGGVSWTDAWLATHQPARGMSRAEKEALKGYTYDGKENVMLGNNLRRRFDRCIVREGTVHAAEIVGKGKIDQHKWPKINPYNNSVRDYPLGVSDHFGLVVKLGPGGNNDNVVGSAKQPRKKQFKTKI